MRTLKRYSILKRLLRRGVMLDAHFLPKIAHVAAWFVCDSWATCIICPTLYVIAMGQIIRHIRQTQFPVWKLVVRCRQVV